MSDFYEFIDTFKKINTKNLIQNEVDIVNFLGKDYICDIDRASKLVHEPVTKNTIKIVIFDGKNFYRTVSEDAPYSTWQFNSWARQPERSRSSEGINWQKERHIFIIDKTGPGKVAENNISSNIDKFERSSKFFLTS